MTNRVRHNEAVSHHRVEHVDPLGLREGEIARRRRRDREDQSGHHPLKNVASGSATVGTSSAQIIPGAQALTGGLRDLQAAVAFRPPLAPLGTKCAHTLSFAQSQRGGASVAG